MKTISMTLATMVGLTSLALAADPVAPAGGAPAAKKAPEAKPAAGAPAATPAKPADKAAPPAKKPEPPKPAPEIAEAAKALTGTWKCTGKMADMADPTKMNDMKVNIAYKLDANLNKFWINGALTGAFKGTLFSTYDANKKMWYRVMVDNMGGSQAEWSSGLKDGKIVWEGDMRGMPAPMPASVKVRTTETMTSAKEMSMKGEMTMDGKTWMTGWEAACKK